MERFFTQTNRLPLMMVALIVSIHALEIGLYSFGSSKKESRSFAPWNQPESDESQPIRRPKRSPFEAFSHFPGFHVIDFSFPTGSFAATKKDMEKKMEEKEVPAQTLAKFTPPKIKNPKERHEKYERKAPVGNLATADYLIDKEPFFEKFDHATVILRLNRLRKDHHIPFLKLLSIRPYFPFFVKT